jgi:hypothetical protein
MKKSSVLIASLIASFLALTVVSVSTTIHVFAQNQVPNQVPNQIQNKPEKESLKNANNSQKSNAGKSILAQTPLSPFARTRVTVVKQRTVRMFQTLPVGYASTLYGGRNFYHYGGRYYGYSGNMYSIIGAPIGIRIRLLPAGYKRVFIGGAPHFYYSGVYYREIGNNEYEVIEPIIGTIVPELPDENVEEVMIDGQTLYEYDNILYKSIVTKDGTQYEVVGKLGT